MWDCLKYLSLVSVLPATDARQLSKCGEAASNTTGKQIVKTGPTARHILAT